QTEPKACVGQQPAFPFGPLCDALLLPCNALATARTFLPNVRGRKSDLRSGVLRSGRPASISSTVLKRMQKEATHGERTASLHDRYRSRPRRRIQPLVRGGAPR